MDRENKLQNMIKMTTNHTRAASSSKESYDFIALYQPKLFSHQMLIPPKSVTCFGGALPKKAIIKDHNGRLWNVGLEKTEQGWYINKNWDHFVSEHSLVWGNLITFRYDGKSQFDVRIFERDGSKRASSLGTSICPILVEDEETTEPMEETTEPVEDTTESYAALVEDEETTDLEEDIPESDACNNTLLVDSREPYNYQRKVNDMVKSPATFVDPRNPHFIKTIARTSRYNMHIPVSLLKRNGIKLEREIVISDETGKKWPVLADFKTNGKIILTIGYGKFRKRRLVSGDKCVFEFVVNDDKTCNEIKTQIISGEVATRKCQNYWVVKDSN